MTEDDDLKHRIPTLASLERWCQQEWIEGVQIDQLNELENLEVHTTNSTYEITVICGATGEILVRGGPFFPGRAEARLAGASLGGSFLKFRGIYVGYSMEFLHEGQYIVTSPILRIMVGQEEATR
jgi:hypothetical protein